MINPSIANKDETMNYAALNSIGSISYFYMCLNILITEAKLNAINVPKTKAKISFSKPPVASSEVYFVLK